MPRDNSGTQKNSPTCSNPLQVDCVQRGLSTNTDLCGILSRVHMSFRAPNGVRREMGAADREYPVGRFVFRPPGSAFSLHGSVAGAPSDSVQPECSPPACNIRQMHMAHSPNKPALLPPQGGGAYQPKATPWEPSKRHPCLLKERRMPTYRLPTPEAMMRPYRRQCKPSFTIPAPSQGRL